jgi:stearoyl-CoA desaturase (Delta-9 desaturase)
MPAGNRCEGAGQGSQRSRRQGIRQHSQPGSGPKPFLAEQGKGNAEIALLWFFIVGPMLAVAGAIPFAWGWGLSWLDIAIGGVFYTVAGLGVTGGFHRLFTHRSYKAKRWLEITLATAACLSLEMSPIGWVAEHRRHHVFSDQIDEFNQTLDPHSPWRFGTTKRALAKGFLHSHMGWLFKRERTNPDRFAKDMVNDPAMRWLDRHYVYIVASSVIAPAVLGGLISWSWHGALTAFFWAGLVRVALLHHVTFSVNSICHMIGDRPFESGDKAANFWPLAILSFGESWHNSHHADPSCARHGVMKGQIDITARLIWIFEKLGWAWDVRWPDMDKFNKKLAVA